MSLYRYRGKLTNAALAFLAFICFSCSKQPAPNLLFILTDDQGYGDLGLHGNPILETPNLDAIGLSGVRFDNFYVSPVCAPTRAAFLTGRRPMSTGAYYVTRGGEIMDSAEYTLAEVLKDNGYATGYFGKWHNGAHHPYHPLSQGFDEFFGFTAGHLNRYFDPELEDNGKMVRSEGYIADIFTERAIRFIEEKKDQAFLCYLAYNTPHSPFQVPDEYFDRYIGRVEEEDSALKIMNAAVYGMVSNIDDNVGRLMQTLRELDLEKNTIVVFTCDNGPNTWRYNAGMKGRKAWVNDGGVRVPFFMQWKGRLPENKIINSTAAHIDLLPTLVNLMGLEFEARREIHGRDLAGLILGMDREEDRVLFTHVNQGVEVSALPGAVRTADWRLVIRSDGSLELTRRIDSGEKRNLADSLSGLADSLKNIYEEWFLPFHSLKIPPIPVGVTDSVILPANEGFLSGNAKFRWSPSGWSNDWATSLDGDSTWIHWPLQVNQNGDYRCFARYTSIRGATSIWVDFNRSHMEKELPAFVPVSDPDFSRIGRAAEAIGQTWARGEIGTVHLSAGPETLKLGTSSGDAEILSLILVKADQ